MAYEVLARKWRPGTFATMVGQEHVLRALTHALEADRLHHAYLFTGTRGVGKTTVARILARCLNCETGVGPEPCGTCASCVEITEGRFVDLIEVDAASRTKVEDTRELLDNVQYAPVRGRYKVYLIDEVHMLSASSFNALLKTLEEPPPHVKFLLATTDPKKLPVTVLSRCLQFHLKNLTPERIVGHLQHVLGEEGVEAEGAALWALARAADGSMRDALSLTDQAIAHGGGRLAADEVARMLGTIDAGALEHIVLALADGDGERLLDTAAQLSEHAADFAAVLADLMSLLHRVSVAQAVPSRGPERSEDAQAALVDQAAVRLTPEDVQLHYQIALTGLRDLPWAPDPRAGFEMTLLRMLAFRPETPDGGARRSVPETAGGGTGDGRTPASAATEAARATQPETPVARAAGHDAAASAPATGRIDPAPGPAARGASVTPLRPRREPPPQPSAAPAAEAPSPEPAPASIRDAGVRDGDDARDAVPDPEGTDADTGPPPLAETGDWHRVLERLSLEGLTRELAAHCLPESVAPGRLDLRLDPGADSLHADVHVGRLEAALEALYGEPWRVRIVTGELEAESPARRAARMRDERQAAAEATVEADPVVRTLIDAFDARIVPGSVRPLD